MGMATSPFMTTLFVESHWGIQVFAGAWGLFAIALLKPS